MLPATSTQASAALLEALWLGVPVGHLAEWLLLACAPLAATDKRWTDSPGCPHLEPQPARADQLALTRAFAVWLLVVALAP